ncbi:MAG: magnesium/cobalt transporter CorA [Anaerolineaceae bacterium]
MIRSVYYSSSGTSQKNLSSDQISTALQDAHGLLWVSLEQPDSSETDLLRTIFHFHPLAIEDCQSTGYQTAKVDDYGEYIFIVAHALQPEPSLDQLDTQEINLFLGSNYLVTSFNAAHTPAFDKIWRRLERDARIGSNGPDFLCHAILDTMVDEYMPLLDEMDERIETIEDQVLEKPSSTYLSDILTLKHSIMTLRRIVAPQREVMNRLSRDDFPQIQAHSRIYFRDIYDHLVRIQDLSESIRDLVSDTLDTYLSATSNRLNEVMKALTIVSTVFLPLSFFAGVWGMNYQYMPELHFRYGYLIAWGTFLSIGLIMIWYFKKRGWF